MHVPDAKIWKSIEAVELTGFSIESALAPVLARIEKIENARGVSNRVQEDSAVKKNDNDICGGIF